VRRALWLAALALPLAAQPKLLINAKLDTRSAASGLEPAFRALLAGAKLDTRSAASGLEPAFRALLAAEPQPAWIGYTVPAVRTYSLGCEFVNRESGAPSAPGADVVHLEPPDHAVILFRVVGSAVERIRTLSPDCEIDAGGVPVHWLTDVRPAESVALLAGLAGHPLGSLVSGAIHAIAMHSEPAALDLLIATARTDRDPRLRGQALSELGHRSGTNVVSAITRAIENDPEMQVKRRAVNALQSLPDGQGIPLLIELVKTTKSPEVRKQAMLSLENTHDPRALAFFEQVLK